MTFRRILVIRLGAMGDLLHLSPSLERLKEAHPWAEVHVLTSPLYVSMVERFAGVDRVWSIQPGGLKDWCGDATTWELRSCLQRQAFDHIVNLQPSLKTTLLAWSCRPQKVSGYPKQRLRVKGSAQRAIPRRHAVQDFYNALSEPFGLPEASLSGLVPRLSAPAPQRTDAPRVALIPGVGHHRSNRAWPIAHWQSLIPTLLSADEARRVLLVGGADEEEAINALLLRVPKACLPRIDTHIGSASILNTADVLAGCQAAIGGDTGPTHLAAAVGLPTLGLFGPTPVRRTGVLNRHVSDPLAYHLTPPETMACWPCEAKRCPLSGEKNLACSREITPEAVAERLAAILQNTPVAR